MNKFAPARIERHLVEQTKILLSRIEALSGRLSTATDVGALMMFADLVADNVSALTGDAIRDSDRDHIRAVEAEYLFSRPLDLRQEARDAIRQQMLKFTAAIRSTLGPPEDEEVPF